MIQKYFILFMGSAQSNYWFWLNFGKDRLGPEQIFCRDTEAPLLLVTSLILIWEAQVQPLLWVTQSKDLNLLAVSIIPVAVALSLLAEQHILSFTLSLCKGLTKSTYAGKIGPSPAMSSHRPRTLAR